MSSRLSGTHRSTVELERAIKTCLHGRQTSTAPL